MGSFAIPRAFHKRSNFRGRTDLLPKSLGMMNFSMIDRMNKTTARILDERLAPFKTDITTLMKDVQTLKDDMRGLKEEQAHVTRIAVMVSWGSLPYLFL